MKQIVSLLALALLAAPARAAVSETEADLKAIVQEVADAIAPGDRAVFDRWLADDFILVDRDGSLKTKKEILDGTTPIADGFTLAIRIGESSFRDFGETAVLVNEVIEDMDVFGQPLHVLYRDTHVFVRRGGGWKMVVWHYVEIPKDPVPIAVDARRFDDVVGEYAFGDRRYLVTRRGGKLFGARAGKAGSETELIPESETVFAVPGSEFRKIFVRDASGRVTGIVDRRKGSDVLWTRVQTEKTPG